MSVFTDKPIPVGSPPSGHPLTAAELGHEVREAPGPCTACDEPIQPGQLWVDGPLHVYCPPETRS